MGARCLVLAPVVWERRQGPLSVRGAGSREGMEPVSAPVPGEDEAWAYLGRLDAGGGGELPSDSASATRDKKQRLQARVTPVEPLGTYPLTVKDPAGTIRQEEVPVQSLGVPRGALGVVAAVPVRAVPQAGGHLPKL